MERSTFILPSIEPPDMSPTEILRQLIAIPSVNPMGATAVAGQCYEQAVCHHIRDWLQQASIAHQLVEVAPGRPSLFAWIDRGAPTTLWFDAHTDTVPVDSMTIAPFAGEVRDGRIYGRGACDVKGGLAAMLQALLRLQREQNEGTAAAQAPNVVLSCTCDEEHDTQGIDHLTRIWTAAEGKEFWQRRPDGCIVAEPTSLDVVIAHRGVVRWEITTAGRACHSSEPSAGISAIYRMARVIESLEEYADALQTGDREHPLCGRPTLSVGRVEGGESINIVPAHCRIEVERRVIPGEHPDQARDEVMRWIADRIEFDVEHRAPWLTSQPLGDEANQTLGSTLLQVASEVAGASRCRGVAFGTHASRTAAAGVSSVVLGPGDIAQAHTDDEWIAIEQLDAAAEIYYRLANRAPDWCPRV